MGLEDREYLQEDWKDSPPPAENPVTKWFVILSAVTFVMEQVSVDVFQVLSLTAPKIVEGEVWRLVTFAFCEHPVNILGIVFGLLIIWKFGTDLERMYGSKELFFYYLGTTLFISVFFSVCQLFANLPMPLEGVFAISLSLLALFATHFPRVDVYILPLISVQLRWLVAIYSLFGLFPAFRAVQNGAGIAGFAYIAPVLGVPFALLYRRFNWHLSGIVGNVNPKAWMRAWRTRAARRNLRVYEPAPDTSNLDNKVDAILAKIHEHGTESLTEAERAVLARASERYKNRT